MPIIDFKNKSKIHSQAFYMLEIVSKKRSDFLKSTQKFRCLAVLALPSLKD